MARTTAELVGGIIEVDSLIPLAPFIEAANALVTELLEPHLKDDGVTLYYDVTRLELIERWLSAHFYTVRDPRSTSEGAGSVRASYQSAVDLGLNTSHYGQMAMRLDTAGILAALDEEGSTSKRKATVHWAGTDEDDL